MNETYVESEREVSYTLELNKVEMIKIVSAYLENTVSNLEIAGWADEVYRQLRIKAQLLDLDKIPYVRFVKTLGRLKDDERWREVQRDDILHILDVLSGKVNASLTMKFQMPFALQYETLNNLRSDAVCMESIKKILESKLKNNKLTDDDVSMLQKFNVNEPIVTILDINKPIVTILDLISSQIKSEINSLDIWDNRVLPGQILLLFPTDLMRDEKLLISRLIRLIDYYLGYDYFNIFCLFKSGIPYISLLP
ncbi:MAG: hypothetical protein LBQ42_12415 [Synergistaceae bacterium]|nr:hypothetical protein [Synergistaceae bacterium]